MWELRSSYSVLEKNAKDLNQEKIIEAFDHTSKLLLNIRNENLQIERFFLDWFLTFHALY